MKRSNCLAAQTLLNIARQRLEHNAGHCQLVLEHLDTTALLHAALQHTLGLYHLSELQFAALIVLSSLDPESVTSADLATHTAVTRSSMTEAIDHLETHHYVARIRDEHDRRIIRVRLTQHGQTMTEPITQAFLRTLAGATRFIDASTLSQLLGGYALLQAGAGNLQPDSSPL